MRKSAPVRMPARGDRLRVAVAAMMLAATLFPARSMGSSEDTVQFAVTPGPLGYGESPGAPSFPSPDQPGISSPGLDGGPETLSARMPGFEVSDASGAGLGWGITVSGDNRPGKSPVLKQYCPIADCRSGPGPGYVAGGVTLPANSLTVDSSGARFAPQRGTIGPPPTYQCEEGCFVDAPPDSPSNLVVAASGAGMGTFRASGFSDSSVRLVAPGFARPLPPKETYRVDLSWTLNRGP
jgi:hypothetical protein